jgi:hypothetical protein
LWRPASEANSGGHQDLRLLAFRFRVFRPFLWDGTFFPFLRASERPIAIACFLLLTLPPLPPLPRRSVPFFFRFMARSTSLPALREYLASGISHLAGCGLCGAQAPLGRDKET